MINVKRPVFAFFMVLSVANGIVFFGANSLVSYFVGELIIFVFCYDLLKIKYRFHIYQVLLFYFYYTLCITHSFSGLHNDHRLYLSSYFVNLLHFIFFVLGYCYFKYRPVGKVVKNKQNKIIFMYMMYLLIAGVWSLSLTNTGRNYSSRFTISPEEVRIGLNIIHYISSNVLGYIEAIFMFINSNPMFYAMFNIVKGFISYVNSGVKAALLGPLLIIFMIFQIYYKTISVKSLFFLFPISLLILTFLIATTVFRNNLSLESLLSIDLLRMNDFLFYFLRSPESSHIIYTANVMGMIESGHTDFRYGFDYFRFILYPFKGIFENFEYASFIQYPSLLAGKAVNQGKYLGLAGELYWNFGYLFFIFSFAFGLALKWFTNLAFSNTTYGIVSYLLLFKTLLWILYRGIGNELTIMTSIFILALLIFVLLRHLINRFPLLGRLFSKW